MQINEGICKEVNNKYRNVEGICKEVNNKYRNEGKRVKNEVIRHWQIKGVNEGKEKDDNFIKEYTSKDSRK